MAKLLLDTSFIVALFRVNDGNNKIAVANKNIISENECYISNYILSEVVTILSLRTKDINLTKNAYHFMLDNFTIINECHINHFNLKVMKLFGKYNQNTFHLSFIDCSLVLLYIKYDLDYLVSFDKWFRKVEELKTYNLQLY